MADNIVIRFSPLCNQDRLEPDTLLDPVPAPTASRNDFADYLKGVLIFLVACGHLIQFVGCQDSDCYYVDPLFKAIYMFHMPLFMAVSGYVSFRAIARTALLPCAWRRARQVDRSRMLLGVSLFGGQACDLHFDRGRGTRGLARFSPLAGALPAHLMVSVGGVFCHGRRFRLETIPPRPSGILCGGRGGVSICSGRCVHLFGQVHIPVFLPGLCAGQGRSAPPSHGAIAVSGRGPFCGLRRLPPAVVQGHLCLYDPDVAGPANLPNIALRYFAGVAVSAMFVLLLRWTYQRAPSPLLSNWGQRSLDIYIMDTFLVEIVATFVHLPVPGSPWFSWLAAPVLAGILCLVAYWAGGWLRGIPVVRALLLGQISKPPSRAQPVAAGHNT